MRLRAPEKKTREGYGWLVIEDTEKGDSVGTVTEAAKKEESLKKGTSGGLGVHPRIKLLHGPEKEKKGRSRREGMALSKETPQRIELEWKSRLW